MARIRSIKPTFFRSRSVKRLNDKQKLVWVGLWPLADDEGRLLDEPGLMVGDLWALSIPEAKLDVILTELHDAGRIIRYTVNGESFIQVTNWLEHQKISKPYPSTIPPVPGLNYSGNVPGMEQEQFRGRGKGEEKDMEGEAPPRKCPRHINDPSSPNCFACRDARLAREDWDKAQKLKPTAAPPSIVYTPDNCIGHKWVAGWCGICGAEKAKVA